jgi:Domain of unknown function (DUF4351)
MTYISSIERTGEARGAFTFVNSLLRRQFGEIPEATSEIVQQLPFAKRLGTRIDQLEQLALELSNFKSITDLTD